MRNATIGHLFILCFVGIVVGLAGFVLFPRIPVLSDSLGYFTLARNLLMGKGLVSSYVGPNEAYIMGLPCPDLHMPGWPIFIAGFMWLTRTGLYAPVLLNILLTLVSAALFYLTVRAWSDARRAFLGSLFFLLFPLTLAYEFTGMAETSLVFWSLLVVFLASLARPKRAMVWMPTILLAYAFVFATRQTSVFLIPLVSLILVERGFPRTHAICFGVALLLVSVVANLSYSRIDSLSEAQSVLFRYDLLLHSGFLKKSFYRDILTPADLNPAVPLPEMLFAILVKKPIRMFVSYFSPDNIWRAENLMKLLVIAVLALGPFLVRNKRMRWGLLAFFPLILMAIWFYKFEARQFLALSTITLAFVFALANGLRIKTYFIAIGLSLEIMCAGLFVWETQAERISVYRAEKDLAPAVAEIMSPGARVAAEYPSTMVLYKPGIAVVTVPASNEDLALLDEKLSLDAIILVGSGSKLEAPWLPKDTLIMHNDTIFVYTRPK